MSLLVTIDTDPKFTPEGGSAAARAPDLGLARVQDLGTGRLRAAR